MQFIWLILWKTNCWNMKDFTSIDTDYLFQMP